MYECHSALNETTASFRAAKNLATAKNNILTLQWIKGHNEAADALARRGYETKPIGSELFLLFPHSWFRDYMNQRIKILHQQ